MANNRTYSVLSGIFERSNEARATPILVSFRSKIQIFRRDPLTFSYGSSPSPTPFPARVSKSLTESEGVMERNRHTTTT